MRKGIIAVISLVSAAAISAGAFFYVQNTDKKDKERQSKELAENQLFDIDSDSIGTIEINGAEGDYLSTTLFCMGLENGLRKCKNDGISALFITKDKHIYTVGADFAEFELTSGDYEYEK